MHTDIVRTPLLC